MSRRVSRPRNVLRITRFLTVFVAAAAVVVSTVAPATLAPASASMSSSTSLARVASDPAQTNIVKTTLAGFNPGNIISDAVFTNKSTMSEAQIQSFLNSKVSSCRSGYTCLKDLKTATQTKAKDSYCAAYAGAPSESAARIIYKVAQACNMNPQVLIVMLQKEQGLVTHTWPSDWRYNAAMGQACPDTAPCNVAFAGFFAQVYGAARQMQIYLEGKYFQWYKAGKTWNILYHPNRSCGTSPVYIANKATEALYYYTPYQPNAAALRAGYGTGDSCSAYGNRNFYNYFTDWFGSTQTAGPVVPPPVLKDINSTSYVAAADSKGNLFAYPYTKSVWGNTVKLASNLGALSSVFSVGDLDGNGRRDFIAVNSAGKPSVLHGGSGTNLGKPVALAGDWTGLTAVLPAGDFNGDGLEDIFTVDQNGILSLRAGNGMGGFNAAVQVGSGWTGMTQLMTGHDFDGDGKSDLVARDPAGNLKLFPGDGASGWGATVQIGNGWNPMSSIFTPGDFTGDGHTDILAHTPDGTLYLYKGSKGGTFTNGGVIGTSWHTLKVKTAAGLKVKPLPVFRSGIGNADAAGGVDVVAADASGTAYLYGGNGAGGWASTVKLATGWKSTDKIVHLGDFDRSGVTDFGRIDSAGRFLMYSGASGKTVQIGTGWSPFTQVFGALDFDGDRKTDVIGITKTGAMYLYRGDGKGGWINPSGQLIGSGWSGVGNVFYAGDFNGDGVGDVIARFGDALRLYPLTGRGGWGKTQQIGQGWASFPTVFSPGDFNGDGHTDLLTIKSNGNMYLYPTNGKGGWGKTQQIGSDWHKMSPIG